MGKGDKKTKKGKLKQGSFGVSRPHKVKKAATKKAAPKKKEAKAEAAPKKKATKKADKAE